MTKGELPFRYLGLPIQTTRLQKKDCDCLVDKICSKIHGYGARKFSYAGRLILVQDVLKSLCSYWASLFVLPKGIIKKVEATCRNFLWDGGPEYVRAPLVAWDKVCRTKEEGGLGLQDMKMVKTELAAGYLNGKWHEQPDGYSPARCYRWLRGVRTKVGWYSVIWNPWNSPKHSFLGWIWVHDALKTKNKLLQFGVTDDVDCMLCGLGIETQEHLFFYCPYSRRVIQALNQVMGGILATHDLLERSMQHPGSQVQKRALYALLVCLVYQLWQQRNRCREDMQVLRPEKLSSLIMQETRVRIRSRDLSRVKQDEVDWLHSMTLL
ncbi:uncharacterized protein LOC141641172 [Silene latifolia]|uniref:uncharacterized protein LOC141641172 n=1 Tax=Silene latifolia TaxID=37657 RepID=UPI003D779652